MTSKPGFIGASALCEAVVNADIEDAFGTAGGKAAPSSEDGLPSCRWSTSDKHGFFEMEVAELDGGASSLSILTDRKYETPGGATVYLTLGSDERTCMADVIAPKTPTGTDLQLRVSAPPESLTIKPLSPGQTWCERLTPQLTKALVKLGWVNAT